MRKTWPIGPDDEPVGWFRTPLAGGVEYQDASYREAAEEPIPVAQRSLTTWRKWAGVSISGWSLFIVAGFLWSRFLWWPFFFAMTTLGIGSCYTTYRAARANIDDSIRAAWQEVVERTHHSTR